VPNTSPTAASFSAGIADRPLMARLPYRCPVLLLSADINGEAILDACKQIKARLQPIIGAVSSSSIERASARRGPC
jgi:hypothetical protein